MNMLKHYIVSCKSISMITLWQRSERLCKNNVGNIEKQCDNP